MLKSRRVLDMEVAMLSELSLSLE